VKCQRCAAKERIIPETQRQGHEQEKSVQVFLKKARKSKVRRWFPEEVRKYKRGAVSGVPTANSPIDERKEPELDNRENGKVGIGEGMVK